MKRHLFITLVLLLVNQVLEAQNLSVDQNYIYSNINLSADGSRKIESVTYFDGLGRPKQSIAIKASPTGQDLVTHISYDNFGRQVDSYLPAPMQTLNGTIQSNPESVANSYYGEIAFSHKTLENSPLDRIQSLTQVGNDWQNHPVRYDYLTNNNNEVLKFKTVTSWVDNATESSLSLADGNYYPEASLYKNKVSDEDGNITYEYKNGQGQTLLVRKDMGTAEASADTYYVYNEYNQLAYVLSPLAVQEIKNNLTVDLSDTGSLLSHLCYIYRYDGRNRLVEKKLPGKGKEYMVYDKADRLVLTQDTNLKNQDKWLFTKYDIFGRVVYTGLLNSSPNRLAQQSAVNNNDDQYEIYSSSGITLNRLTAFYTSNAYPKNNYSFLSVNYYDTYPKYDDRPSHDEINAYGQALLTDDGKATRNTKGLPTASFVKNIENDKWTKTYSFYDEKGRPVYSHSINHLGGFTKSATLLDFSGVPLNTRTEHKHTVAVSAEQVKIDERFVYDNENRLKEHYHQVNGGSEELLTKNTYNSIGQLEGKSVGNGLESTNYSYNIRGWMTGINLVKQDPLQPLNYSKIFSYKIKYTDAINSSLKKFNGNISEIDWSYYDYSSRYEYTYDKLNRLRKANFMSTDDDTMSQDTQYYNEEVSYDLNGNIKTLKRNASPVRGATGIIIDDLEYTYENSKKSNRVSTIYDHSQNFSGYPASDIANVISYDDNGNMTTMLDKGITGIEYNYLNLPKKITQHGNPSDYMYRADGVKLARTFFINGEAVGTEYLDSFVYTNAFSLKMEEALIYDDVATKLAASAGQLETFELVQKKPSYPDTPQEEKLYELEFFPTAEGFYDYKNSKYIYQYKDHLGNVRLSYSRNSSTGILIEEGRNDYYPFGLNFVRIPRGRPPVYNPSTTYHNYKYNGKELQETGMYDYGARMYMPDIGRWGVVDPLAETSRRFSPYTYVYNNPIMFIDPTGMIGELATCPTCPNTPEFKPFIDDQKNTYVYDPETKKAEKEIQIEEVKLKGSSSWNVGTRALGGLQMVGGALEAVVGGVGGILTAETGVGAALGWLVLMNGIDNTTTGAQQLWTGEDEETLLHQGVKEGSLALGADEETAENIATGADVATLALGGGSGLKSAKNLKPMYKNTKGLKQIGLRATNTNKQLRLERHALQGTGRKLTRTHINRGVGGKKHTFFRNAKELRKYVKE